VWTSVCGERMCAHDPCEEINTQDDGRHEQTGNMKTMESC